MKPSLHLPSKVLLTLCIIFCTQKVSAQIIYVCTSFGDLISVDLSTCTSTLIGNTNNPQADIALTPNGTLYGIDFSTLVTISTTNAATAPAAGLPPLPTAQEVALVSDANGVLYSASSNLYRLDPVTNTWILVGSLSPYAAGGDLTFYNGDLYMAGIGQELVKIILNPFSVQLIGNMLTANDPIFGIITAGQTIVDTCTGLIIGGDSTRMFATGGQTIFEVDPLTAVVTPYCTVSVMQQTDILFGAASPEESQSTPGNSSTQAIPALLPNVFTPNGDNTNDMFVMRQAINTGPCETNPVYTLEVYNRWGNKLFSGDALTGWDGNYSGAASPDGVYFWRVSVNTQSGTTSSSGFVSLFR